MNVGCSIYRKLRVYGRNSGGSDQTEVWYLIVSIPDLCTLTYFTHAQFNLSSFLDLMFLLFVFSAVNFVLDHPDIKAVSFVGSDVAVSSLLYLP